MISSSKYYIHHKSSYFALRLLKHLNNMVLEALAHKLIHTYHKVNRCLARYSPRATTTN